MRLAEQFLEHRALILNRAKIDDVPMYRWKTPLQRCVQILKRHRDFMFKDDDDNKPISIIITTLAGQAYNGEADIGEALTGILTRMDTFVRASGHRIPNPVNPAEDFADKWASNPKLEESFRSWLLQARRDYGVILRGNVQEAVSLANRRLKLSLSENDIAGFANGSPSVASEKPKVREISSKPAARPWYNS
jgi:hypothetical protein